MKRTKRRSKEDSATSRAERREKGAIQCCQLQYSLPILSSLVVSVGVQWLVEESSSINSFNWYNVTFGLHRKLTVSWEDIFPISFIVPMHLTFLVAPNLVEFGRRRQVGSVGERTFTYFRPTPRTDYINPCKMNGHQGEGLSQPPDSWTSSKSPFQLVYVSHFISLSCDSNTIVCQPTLICQLPRTRAHTGVRAARRPTRNDPYNANGSLRTHSETTESASHVSQL